MPHYRLLPQDSFLTRRDLLRRFGTACAALSFTRLLEPTADANSVVSRPSERTSEFPISKEELERRCQEIDQGCRLYTTAEVLAHLRGSSSC